MPGYAERVPAPAAKQAAPRAARPQPRSVRPSELAIRHSLQLKAARDKAAAVPPARAESRSGLPNSLRAGVEALSGLAMDDVRVHRDSPEPARLGALAFTEGSAIHLGPGQERHLPHEAWHVVQQKQGRVNATAQLKTGVALNDDSGLEREADVMGAKAISATLSGDRTALPAESIPAPRPAAVVQRAIGYEVEIGGIEVSPIAGMADPNLAKGDVLWRGTGWDASVDELGGNVFDLEFRTDPFDDLAAGGRGKAEAALQAIATQWEAIDAAGGPNPATQFDGEAPDNVQLNAGAGNNACQLQATAGLSLAALERVRSGAAANALVAARPADPALGHLGDFGALDLPFYNAIQLRLPNIRAALGLGGGENVDQLAAVIGMIVKIPITSYSVGTKYAKANAGSLLARTDFATILRQLPANQVQAIQTHVAGWRAELINICRAIIAGPHAPPAVTGQTAVFRPGSFKRAPAFATRLRMGDWFRDLAQGHDRLTAADYGSRYPGRAETTELESLGSYGEQMDPGSYTPNPTAIVELAGSAALVVAGAAMDIASGLGGGMAVAGGAGAAHAVSNLGTANRNRPIFEFRSLGQPDSGDLVAAGLALWDYVELAEQHQAGGANQLSRFQRLWNWLAS